MLDATEVDWYQTMGLNLKGAFFRLQQAGLRMKARGRGVIINISDVAGLRPWKKYPLHSISKAGLNMITQVGASALAPEVRVNGIAPGPVMKPAGMSNERWQEIGLSTALQGAGDPDHISETVLFLLANEYITGATIPVDGGTTIS